MMHVAIIGGGMAGVTAASHLIGKSRVTLFDKSRGLSGRMSTRRTETFEFDHGAQYFTAKDPRFQAAVAVAVRDGLVAQWRGVGQYLKNGTCETDTGGARYVAVPRMNIWVKDMAAKARAADADFAIHLSHRAETLSHNGHKWSIGFEGGGSMDGFDWVIMAAPSPQISALFPADFAQADVLSSVKMDACFALMLGLNRAPDVAWDSLRSADGPSSWMAIGSDKPDRPEAPTLMVHAGPEWSNAYIDRDREAVQAEMTASALEVTGLTANDIAYATLHGWRYAAVSLGAGQACLIDTDKNLIAAGDWCPGGRVEGAYLSGLSAAETILATAQ